ncbi:hypothetical protein EDB83DRAFT_1927642 [Lactarius deliciosus]|nr:hypothetical protein EDB83DRAFT_1927642 [Lactarius deliciosus]
MAAHVSRDGRDLVVLSRTHQVVFIRDFERICRGETSLEHAGLVLSLLPQGECLLSRDSSTVVSVWQPWRGSIFSPSALIFRRRLFSCDPPITPRLGRVLSAAWSSRTVAYILHGKMQGVGRTYRCSKMWKVMRNSCRQ